MKLRYLQTYDKDGVDSERTLQYWDEESGCWEDVPFVRIAESREDDYKYDPDATY